MQRFELCLARHDSQLIRRDRTMKICNQRDEIAVRNIRIRNDKIVSS